MLDIFRKRQSIRNTSGTKAPYELKNILRMLEVNKEHVTEYYRYKSKTVSTKDIMVKILKYLSIDNEMDRFSLLERIDAFMGQINRQFKLISTVSKGEEVNGNYYILEEDDTNYFEDNWEEFVPLRPLFSRYDSLLMDHPYQFIEVVYILNVKLLAIQYLQFIKTRDGEFSNIQEFVYRYPYTNAIPHFNSIAIYNKLVYPKHREYKNKHPFHVIDFNRSMDKIFTKYKHDLSRKTVLVQDVLLSIDTLTGTLLDTFKMEFPIFNGNNIKPFIIIYGYIIFMVLNILSGYSKRYNKHNLNYYLLFYKYGITSRMDSYELSFLEPYKDEVNQLVKYLKG